MYYDYLYCSTLLLFIDWDVMNYTDYSSAIHVFLIGLSVLFKTSLLWKAWYYQLGYTFMRTRFQLSVLTSRYELSGSKKVHFHCKNFINLFSKLLYHFPMSFYSLNSFIFSIMFPWPLVFIIHHFSVCVYGLFFNFHILDG